MLKAKFHTHIKQHGNSGLSSPLFSRYVLLYCLQVIILDVRVPCTPVARLNNHRACVNGIAWAPHSSCHICTAGKLTHRTNSKGSFSLFPSVTSDRGSEDVLVG